MRAPIFARPKRPSRARVLRPSQDECGGAAGIRALSETAGQLMLSWVQVDVNTGVSGPGPMFGGAEGRLGEVRRDEESELRKSDYPLRP